MFTRRIKKGIVSSLILACLVFLAISLYSDLPGMLQALARFQWSYLPLILACTLFNYLGRYVKWSYYLHKLAIKLPWQRSLLIFLSGLSMAITPGKVGEVLKSYLLKDTTGVPISYTAPIIVAERLTDGIAMLGLAATGLVLYRFGWEILLFLLLTGILGIILVQQRRLVAYCLQRIATLPGGKKIVPLIQRFYESTYVLLQWRPLLLAILIGFISWSGECLALYFVFRGLGSGVSSILLIKSTFILAVSSLIGSASGLPGGLGTADGSVLGLTRLLVSPSASFGGAATLLIRFSTLWFGLGIGVFALVGYRLLTRNDEDTTKPDQERQALWINIPTDPVSPAEPDAFSHKQSVITSTGDTFL